MFYKITNGLVAINANDFLTKNTALTRGHRLKYRQIAYIKKSFTARLIFLEQLKTGMNFLKAALKAALLITIQFHFQAEH